MDMIGRFLVLISGVGTVLAAITPAARADDWSVINPILDKHCARCHQAGQTKGKFKDQPAGKFGFVLDEPELVRRNKLIPGNAEGSQIFVTILKGDMPKDTEDACLDGSATNETYCGLSKDEKAALHDAINRLKRPVAPSQVVAEATPAPSGPAPIASEPSLAAPSPTANAKPVEPSIAPDPSPATPAVVAAKEPLLAAPRPVPVQETPPPASIPFITDREIIRLISADVSNAPPGDGQNYRYLTLTHLVNAGDPERDLRVYRLALAKLVNSLSTVSDPYTPVAVDGAKTIYRLDIRRLGWSRDTWNTIVAADPYVVLYEDAQYKSLQRDLYTPAPFIHADWFTFSVSRPPLYYQVLDLPHTKQELQAKLGMRAQSDFDDHRVDRAGFQQSGVSDNNRMIERHAIGTGAYWESYDFGANGDRKNLFQFPLGPHGAFRQLSDRFGFDQDGGEIIFNLPNGFHAYYLTDGKGNRLDIGPTRIVRDPAQRDLAVTNGISCMGCHDKGVKFNDRRPGKPLDQVRDLVLPSGSFPPEAKDIVKATFPTGPEFNRILENDAKHYADALTNAGVNVNTRLDGVEMINALSKRFDENLNARLAAAEVGMTEAAFMERLNAAGGPAYDLKLRLQQDLVPRDQFVSLYAPLVNTINDFGDKAIDMTKVAKQSGTTVAAVSHEDHKSPQASKTFDLAFFANTTTYRVGDRITFTLKSEQPCFLTILDTDSQERSAVLFPNGFHPDNRIEAGVTYTVPSAAIGNFKIVPTEPGVERITALCNASFPDFASLDFSHQKFATFANSRDLLEARSLASNLNRKRLLSVVSDASEPSNGQDFHARQEPPIAGQLVSNPLDRTIPITASKSVVLTIRR